MSLTEILSLKLSKYTILQAIVDRDGVTNSRCVSWLRLILGRWDYGRPKSHVDATLMICTLSYVGTGGPYATLDLCKYTKCK